MNCELLATCSALGYLEGDIYHKEPDCLESVKDLIRYLKYEDETCDVRQQLGAAQILQGDLLPILIQHCQDKPLFDAVIRLMVNLTQPALLCFGKVPQDPSFRHHFLQVLSYLQAYKEAFANEKTFGVLSETLYELLQLGWEERQEEDNLLIERILLLVRNILHIPADRDQEKSIDDEASLHDRLLWAMHLSGLDDLMLFLASSAAEQQWSLHVLEIVSLMFRDQNPEQLAMAGQARSARKQGADMTELEILRRREMAEKKSRVFQRSSRHSRFGGSYVIQGLKSIGDRDVVFHKSLHNFQTYSPDMGKDTRYVPRRRQIAQDHSLQRRSALNVRLFLRDFCSEFLENCYNRLMGLVKDHLLREKAQQHDETYYLWALAFFMTFNRASNFRPGLVSETLSVRTFHFIEQNLTNYYEMMLTDRKEAVSWGRRMHLALKAYQELLATVNKMDTSADEAVRESSRIIKNNVFYIMEYRELFLTLFRKFDETRQPRSYLCDLVETTHLFLKMLEHFCRSRGNLMVQNKRRRKKKKKAHPQSPASAGNGPYPPEGVWPALAEQLKHCAQNSELTLDSVVPFDAASEVPVEEQRTEAMVRIQDSLLAGQAPEALTLLRSAREVWPEGDIFGSPDFSLEEEIELLRQIFSAPLPRQQEPEEQGGEEEGEEEEEEEEELQAVQILEKEFNFLDYLRRFACSAVVKACVLLLQSYQKNSPYTNHCVVKMLHRLAHDLKMEALLFQISLFCLFHRLFNDPASGAYKELVTFARYVLAKFFALTEVNRKAFVELLFWKNTAVVREMTEGYGSLDAESSNRKPPKWNPEEEKQLRELYLAHKDIEGEDVIDAILAHLNTTTRSRKQVIHQLVRLGLADSVKDFQRQRKGTNLVLWTEDQELELQRLFEEFQGSDDVLGHIMKNITAKRSRARIVEKLLSLGLVADRRELYKKRQRKPVTSSLLDGKDHLKDRDQEDLEENCEEDEEGPEAEAAQDTSVHIPQSLRQILQEEDFSAPILWLQNCLIRIADDREEDGCTQAVPLVPLTEENEDAVENQDFQKLLRKLGIRPPASEQESFWRVPAKLSPALLRRAAASLSQAEPEPQSADRPEQGPRKEKLALAPGSPMAAKKRKNDLGSSEGEADKEPLSSGPQKLQLLDSDGEQEKNESKNKDSDPGSPEPPRIHKRRRFLIEDEDD
ncbi:protein timeless homolog isoform X2 [Phascolarctos cinereus]|uniref:Protein timeless homolog n=1 Tax=Phascolarctos cinereus TaxID=38626 RepID=A0A6P5KJ73_PHACI|nr:protein timeless homolog [Phascolarctos cinereus]XP_020845705.1 protein timeless homolog [Phascolarctos cinereus]